MDGTLQARRPSKAGKSFVVGILYVYGRHHHGGALKERLAGEGFARSIKAEDGLGDVRLIEILVVVGGKEGEVFFTRNLCKGQCHNTLYVMR